MVKLSTITIGFIIASAMIVVLISSVATFTSSFNITPSQLYNDTGGRCTSSYTQQAISDISKIYQNQTVDSGTYAPGQINAQVGDSMVTSTQSSGLVVSLKTAVAPLTLTKGMIGDFGCVLGIPEEMILAFQVAFGITILLLIAGIFYFRPI